LSPFYAGFGNRETDAVSYTEVNIPAGKIFIVDPSGNLSHYEQLRFYNKTYKSLAEIVDMVFTPCGNNRQLVEEHTEQTREEYNDFNYWKLNNSNDSIDSGDL